MKDRVVFLNVKDRFRTFAIMAPYLKRAVAYAGCDLVVLDDCSADPRIQELVQWLEPYAVDRREKPYGMAEQFCRAGELALQYGLSQYVSIDDDVVVGEKAIAEALDAKVSAKWPCCTFIARNRRDLARDSDGYCVEPKRFFFLDCLRTISVEALQKHPKRQRALLHGSRVLCGLMGGHLRLRRPQVECQHIGFWAGSGAWHAYEDVGSWWVHKPAANIDGGPLVVPGFNLDLYKAAMADLDSAAEGFGKFVNMLDPRPYVLHVSVIDPIVKSVMWWLNGQRRLLIVWDGKWEGNCTRQLLGVDLKSRWIRVIPNGAKHDWLPPAERMRILTQRLGQRIQAAK